MSRSLRVGSASTRHVRPLEVGTRLKNNTREGFLARGSSFFATFSYEKLGYFLENVIKIPKIYFEIFRKKTNYFLQKFSKNEFFFGNFQNKSQVSLDFRQTLRPAGGDIAAISPMYPLELYTTLKSNPRRASRREDLAEFGPSATAIREVKLEISTKISEVDFATSF